jgi:hypothetical protein
MARRQAEDADMIVLGLLIAFVAGVVTGMEWYRHQYAELRRTERGSIFTRRAK